MSGNREALRREANGTRYQPGQRPGHYESFFQRANHPTRPLALWIRYTLFSPAGQPEAALGELWAVFFDGEIGRHIAVKLAGPLAGCTFERGRFGVQVAARNFKSLSWPTAQWRTDQ
jgi:hypothetical protein